MKYLSLPLLFVFFFFSANILAQENGASPSELYKSDWTSLRKHQTPEWLINAKFGIYCHWGIQTLQYIPEYEYLSNDKRIKLFKGENFDADNWAALFEKAGAKFGGVIAWHGSAFKHWNTQYSDYNSFKMGPKIDIVGEVSRAVKKRGLKSVVTFHAIEGEEWINFAKEAVDKYEPDVFWVDASFGGTKGAEFRKAMHLSKYIGNQKEMKPVFAEKYQRNFLTYYYNHAIQKTKEVEFMYKSFDIPPNVGMRDYENGILPKTAYDVWVTDMDMTIPPDWETHGWFYREGVPMRSANELVDMLVDVVSKNGILLLNIPPMADGTFSKEVKDNLTELGEWLSKNGEAIYGTSPWFMHGEGTNEIAEGKQTYHHNNHFAKIQYSEKDIRFTTKGDNLYAACLGKPESKLNIKSLNSNFKLHQGLIKKITHLGSGKTISYQHNENGLELNLSDISLDDKANVFKVEMNFGE